MENSSGFVAVHTDTTDDPGSVRHRMTDFSARARNGAAAPQIALRTNFAPGPGPARHNFIAGGQIGIELRPRRFSASTPEC